MINPQAYALGAHRSCIRDLFEYGNARAKEVGRENIFDYSLGNPSIPTPEAVTETLQALLKEQEPLALHGYTSAAGDPECRAAIAAELNRRYGADTKPEEFFLTCGAAPALCAVLKALSVKNARLLVFAPYFPEYLVFAGEAGLAVDTVLCPPPEFSLSPDAIAQAVTPDTVAVLVNSPNNPTGTVYSTEDLVRLAALLREKAAAFGHPIYILSDEPYRELVYDGYEVPFLPRLYPNTVVCYSYSKSLSLPGERIGYVYVPSQAENGQELLTAVAGAARAAGHVCAPALWQKLVARCAHLRPDLASYDKNRQALDQGLLDAGYEAAQPQGAFYLFVKAPGGDAQAFSDFAKTKDVLLVPGDGFGCPGWFRLCYCVSPETIERSLSVFSKLRIDYLSNV